MGRMTSGDAFGAPYSFFPSGTDMPIDPEASCATAHIVTLAVAHFCSQWWPHARNQTLSQSGLGLPLLSLCSSLSSWLEDFNIRAPVIKLSPPFHHLLSKYRNTCLTCLLACVSVLSVSIFRNLWEHRG